MVDGVATISERVAADNYERVARDAEMEAENYQWLAAVALALQSPKLSDAAKHEVYGLVLQERDYETVSVDRPAELRVEQNLERAGKLAESMADSALRRHVDAAEMAQWVEQHGLPD